MLSSTCRQCSEAFRALQVYHVPTKHTPAVHFLGVVSVCVRLHLSIISLYHQVIELEPKNERNFYKRFRVFLSKRKYAEAIKDLSRALELKPKYKQVCVCVCVCAFFNSIGCTNRLTNGRIWYHSCRALRVLWVPVVGKVCNQCFCGKNVPVRGVGVRFS